jgi:hypothetical protein
MDGPRTVKRRKTPQLRRACHSNGGKEFLGDPRAGAIRLIVRNSIIIVINFLLRNGICSTRVGLILANHAVPSCLAPEKAQTEQICGSERRVLRTVAEIRQRIATKRK